MQGTIWVQSNMFVFFFDWHTKAEKRFELLPLSFGSVGWAILSMWHLWLAIATEKQKLFSWPALTSQSAFLLCSSSTFYFLDMSLWPWHGKHVYVQDFGTFTSPQAETAAPARSGTQTVRTSFSFADFYLTYLACVCFRTAVFFPAHAVFDQT